MLTRAMVQSVQDLIASRRSWTVFALARDRHGEEVKPTSKEACSWCTVGAIRRILSNDPLAEIRLQFRLDDAAKLLFGHLTIMHLNDHAGHDEVMRCFDHVKEKLT